MMSANNSMNILCTLCEKQATLKCCGCNVISYCTSQHLKEHAAIHKSKCKPYVVSRNDQLGRFLLASRNIKKGEILFQETPLVVGPGESTSSPMCLSCGGIPSKRCDVCNVAILCGLTCPGKEHSISECELYKNISVKIKSRNFLHNTIVLPIRCLVNLKNPTGEWVNFFNLESHNEKRRDTQIWESHQKNIIQVLLKWGVITPGKDEEYIHTIMGVLDVNSFEVRCGLVNQGRALYVEAALMTHDCLPNCTVAVDNNYIMTVKARTDIPEGKLITYCYTNTLHGTDDRKVHLLETKYFTCHCSRCEDPTEFDTHLSSLVCPRCRKGLIVHNSKEKHWICDICKRCFTEPLINATLLQVRFVIDDTNYFCCTKEYECVIAKLSKTLAPNHSYLIDLKQKLAVMYRDEKQNQTILDRRRKICEELLLVLNKVEPGISRIRGIALYELYNIILNIAELKQNNLTLLLEAECTLKEAVSLLLHEPTCSPEGSLTRQALSELKYLRNNIQQIEKCVDKTKKK